MVKNGMKICSKCKISKNLTEFPKYKYSKSGVNSRCNSCVREYNATPKLREMRRGYEKRNFTIIVNALGKKCDSCGEKYNPELKKSNLDIHHREYSEEDKKYFKKHGIGQQKYESLRMIKTKKINELKKKYVLLCKQCHQIETFCHQSPKKAFDMFAWLYGEGLFDEVLKDDPTLKKLTDFLD
ncbi:hypothetical protein [Nitrosopumilus sp.]|uniref:hypothetical protein n=1 Tax=Nitrosopumilus sp. TaxID=2024843 RepID=UPI00247C63CC|nr:hypothetical protein [Nitrosopumilus sp.]MCV0431829.1 hypothetical protein [Nitrosopumilus sp.]